MEPTSIHVQATLNAQKQFSVQVRIFFLQGSLDKLERIIDGTLSTPFNQIDEKVRDAHNNYRVLFTTANLSRSCS